MINEIERRWQAAQAKNWRHQKGYHGAKVLDYLVDGDRDGICIHWGPEVAEFIAHAPTDIAYLLRELRDTRELLGRAVELLQSPVMEEAVYDTQETSFRRCRVCGCNVKPHAPDCPLNKILQEVAERD